MSFLRDKVKPDMRYLVSKQAVVFVLSIPPFDTSNVLKDGESVVHA